MAGPVIVGLGLRPGRRVGFCGVSSRRVGLLWDPRVWAAPYVAMWFGIGFLPSVGTDLDSTFWPSAKVALGGHPLLVYSVAGQAEYPNANGPLALLPLTGAGLIMRALGWLDAPYPHHATVLAVFSLFVLLMASEGVAAIERLQGHRLEGWKRLLGYAALALTPPVWQSVEGFGHLEQPIEIWLVLLAVRWMKRDWIIRAGIVFGLALLSRSSAVLLSIPLALASGMRSPTIAARFFAAAAVTGAMGLLPFYLADRADVVHSLFNYRGGLPVGAGSIWSVTRGGALAPLAQHWDIVAVLVVALAANLWLATRRGGFTEGRLFAGMTLASASFALLAKTVWPYYFFEVFILGTIWAVGTWRREYGFASLLLAPMAISIMGMVAEVGSLNGLPPESVRLEGVGMFLMLGLVMAWIAWRGPRVPLGRSGAERDSGMSAT
jgi:hypothetical protein